MVLSYMQDSVRSKSLAKPICIETGWDSRGEGEGAAKGAYGFGCDAFAEAERHQL